MFTSTENLFYVCLNYIKLSLNQQHNRTVGHVFVVTEATYRRSTSTKAPASAAGTVSETRLKSQVGRVREVVCAWISVCLQSERWCQYWSAYVAARNT